MFTVTIQLPNELGVEAARLSNPDFVDKTNEEYLQYVITQADLSYRSQYGISDL